MITPFHFMMVLATFGFVIEAFDCVRRYHVFERRQDLLLFLRMIMVVRFTHVMMMLIMMVLWRA